MKSREWRRFFRVSKHTLGVVGVALLVAEAALILVSWILSATMLEGVRSLLSDEGIRWLFGRFVSLLASPPLVWLLLLLVAFGCLQKSGLTSLRHSYRERTALHLALLFLLGYIVVILLLTVVPHAILLSASGSLFPSAFTRSLVPVIAFGLLLVSIAFGTMAGRFRSLSDVVDALSFGIQKGAPLFLLYILLVQFWASLRFVFA